MAIPARESIYNLILGMTEADWDYYAPAHNNIRLGRPFVEDITAVDFILGFFQKGGKPIVTEKFQVHTFGRPRAEHTVSVFFFGVLLYTLYQCQKRCKVFDWRLVTSTEYLSR